MEQVVLDRDATPLGGSRRAGNVFKATWNNTLVVVKLLSKETPVDALLAQVELWESLNHPHVLRVFGASPPDADPLFIITQYHLNGNANMFLAKNPGADRSKILFETAVGMQYLHGLGLVHGSLKPTNILITENIQACIADCSLIEINPSSSTSAHRYFSPEAWKGTLSRPSDVFAFAMTAFEIFTSAPPWGVLPDSDIYQLIIREDSRPDRPEQELEERVGLTDQTWAIIEHAWHKESRQRPSFEKIVTMWQNIIAVESSGIKPSDRVQEDASDTGRHAQELGLPTEMASLHTWRTAQNPFKYTNSILSGPPAYDVAPSVRSLPKHGTPPTPYPQASSPGAVPQYTHPLSKNKSFGGYSDKTTRSFSLPVIPVAGYPAGDPRRFNYLSKSASKYRDEVARTFSPAPSSVTNFGNDGSASSSASVYDSKSAPQSPTIMNFRPGPRHISSHSSLQSSVSWNSPNSPDSQVSPMAIRSAQFSGITSIDENKALPYTSQDNTRGHSSTPVNTVGSGRESRRSLDPNERPFAPQPSATASDGQSIMSGSQWGTSSLRGGTSAVLLANALHMEVTEGRRVDVINRQLTKVLQIASASNKEAQKLVTAGTVPTLILLLKARAADAIGLEVVLIALGVLAFDPISANTIYRTNTITILIEIFASSSSPDITTLSVWCMNRMCRSPEVAAGLIKQDIASVLMKKGLKEVNSISCLSAWCLGSLACSDALAEILTAQGLVQASANHLRICSESPNSAPDDICAAVYIVARMSRTIKISKALAKAGCVKLLAHHLNTSVDPRVLLWTARAVGCLMRPNSSDMSKALLDAGTAKGLARLPRVLPTEEVEPLESFAFAIQRFSCAEWGGGTRKALVEAGVVDSLLAALRTAADVPYPHVHIELALAVSFLGDVGGSSIRKEIINAGGIDILKRVSAAGTPEVAKACNMAVTSITGNLWTRNAASAKTAMAHNWSGGCPDFQPGCPLTPTDEQVADTQ